MLLMAIRSDALTIHKVSCRCTALALAFCCGGWLVPASLRALVLPTPEVEILYQGDDGQLHPGLPPEVLIGEDFHFKLRVSPPSSTLFPVGYGPFVELYLQYDGADCNQPLSNHCDGLQFQAASAEFTTTVLPLTPCPAAPPGPPFVFGVDPLVNPSCLSAPPAPPCPGTISAPPSCFFGAALPSTCMDPVAGFQKVVLGLPFGSFVSKQPPNVPGQPPVLIDVTVHVDSFANNGFPLTVKARGGFQYDHDPSGATPAALDLTCPMTASATTVPRVLRVHKKYLGPEDETATGPNFPVTYAITVDVADGQTVNSLVVNDCLPGSLVFIPPAPPGCTFAGGCLTCTAGSVTGGLTHPDLSFAFQAYVPLDASPGQPVLGPSCKTPVDNHVTALFNWFPLDPREPGQKPAAQADHKITAKCIALQKSVGEFHDTGAPGPTPDDVLLYTLDFEISDFDTFDGIVLDDYLADGLLPMGIPVLTVSDKFPNSPVTGPIPPVVSVYHNSATRDVYTCNDGSQMYQPTHLHFDISSALATLDPLPGRHGLGILTGGLAGLPAGGPAKGTITFRAKIADQYLRQLVTPPNVKKDDTLPNCPVISGDLLINTDAPAPPPPGVIGNGDDDSLAKVTIVTGILKKSIFEINGHPPPPSPPPPLVSPGDTVTFRLQYPVPSTDAAALSFDDFFPSPMFSVSGTLNSPTLCSFASFIFSTGSGMGIVTPLSVALCPFASPTPQLTPSSTSNSVHIAYGTLNDSGNAPRSVDLLLRLTATAAPFVDGLHFTNHVLESEQNSFGVPFGQTEVAQMMLGEPELRIRKGVVGADDPAVQFSPPQTSPLAVTFQPPGSHLSPPFTGRITSMNVGTALNSDATNVDGCDRLRFVIAIENIGHSAKGAFNVRLKDQLPACLQNPTNLQVVRGDGTPLSCIPFPCSIDGPFGLFGSAATGITLRDTPTMGALDPGSVGGVINNTGTNIAIITFDATVPCTIAPTGCCTNTAKLLSYAGVPGGPNHVLANFSTPFPDTTNPFSDGASVCIQPRLTKAIVATSEPSTTGSNLAIGEIVRYRLRMALPVGVFPGLVLTDLLPQELEWMPVNCILSFKDPHIALAPGFPTLTGAGTRTLTVNFGTAINLPTGPNGALLDVECNALVLNLPLNNAGDHKLNSFTATLHPHHAAPVTFHSNVVQAVIVEPAGSLVKKEITGGTFRQFGYSLSYTNTGTATAFNVHIRDPLPTPLTVMAGPRVITSASSISCTVNSPPPSTVVDVTCPEVPPGGMVTVNFAWGLPPCLNVTNQATLTYTSLPGTNGTVVNPTGASTPGASGSATGERIYTSTASVVTVHCPDLAIAKSHSSVFNPAAGGVYTIVVTNVGDQQSVPPATVTDVLPSNVIFQAAGGAGWTCAAAAPGTVTCTNSTPIPPGGSSSFTITVAPQDNGPFDNCATVATTPDLDPGNNQACDHIP
jgi:uncharacterized repeat protein (TIGR01451 family)